MTTSCAAIICVKNEAIHIVPVIRYYSAQGIDLVIIDHESSDGTRELCRQHIGRGVLEVVHMPWEGKFDLTRQLQVKREVAASLQHEWLIHADADEMLQSPVAGETLLQGIDRLSYLGFTVVNFEEFVFIPAHGQNHHHAGYREEMLNYYFFEPSQHRLMRAWKRASGLDNVFSGGHKLRGPELKVASEPFILRHYLVLSEEHAISKYVGRTFSDQDLEAGMHGNRLDLSASDLRLPPQDALKRLERWDSIEFDRSDPKRKHYWQW